MTSFNLTWKNDTKLTGKVFARKRKPKTENNIVNTSQQNLSDKLPKLKVNKLAKNLDLEKKVIKTNNNKNNEQHQEVNFDKESGNTKPSKLVKRKQKKDKLLAKHAVSGGYQGSSSEKPKQKEHGLFSVGNKDVYIKANTKGKSVIEEVFSVNKKFCDLEIHKYIVSNLEKIGYTTLMNVQEKSIPIILSGKNVLVSEYLTSSMNIFSFFSLLFLCFKC